MDMAGTWDTWVVVGTWDIAGTWDIWGTEGIGAMALTILAILDIFTTSIISGITVFGHFLDMAMGLIMGMVATITMMKIIIL